jgi:hypothetical protein
MGVALTRGRPASGFTCSLRPVGLSSRLGNGESMGANVEREAQEQRRRERLAASLRENLKRRKAQQRGRAALDAPATDDAPAPEATRARV